jgi:hypothetical protein
MGDREDLLAEAERAYGELREAVAGLDEASMNQVWLGTWSVREILIHISGWQREVLPALGRIGRGEPAYPEGVSYDDVDAWNRRFVEARAGVKAADAIDELAASHRDFVRAAGALAAEDLTEQAAARELFLGAGAPHYREHTEQIRGWRERASI